MSAVSDDHQAGTPVSKQCRPPVPASRILAWSITAIAGAYVIDNFLTVWLEWPGLRALFTEKGSASPSESLIQMALYIGAVALVLAWVFKSPQRGLRDDSAVLANAANYIIKVAFWSVLFIGLADALISFLRVENLLPAIIGDDLTKELGKSRVRGPFVHMPFILLAFIVASRTKTLGFQWLSLLVVVAELLIVVTRFVYSYEQAFQGDLVRFWYGALFLFASAFTLYEDGHVRVDVLYTSFSTRKKGGVNALGCLLLGLTLCWTILIFGMWDKSSIINSPLLNFEVSQSGFGMYVKFWMASFLAIFALTMTIQFCSYLLESIADFREDPGHREPPPAPDH